MDVVEQPNRVPNARPRDGQQTMAADAAKSRRSPSLKPIASLTAAESFEPMDWLYAAGLVAAVFLVYYPCWHGGFLFDDDLHLLNNPVLKPGGLGKIWVPGGYLNYWPVTFTAYWLEYQIWGLHTLGYHLVNLALHSAAALLVWRILVRLQVPGAMLAAAIFALHPVNVESVAWIAQLKGILSLVFALVSVLFYLSNERHPSRWRYALAIATFLLSALAKGAAVTLPIVLLACAWWQRGRIERRDVWRVVPYFLIGALMTGLEIWGQHFVARGDVVRADGIFSRAAIAGSALWFYLGKLILPINLSPLYPRWSTSNTNVLSYLPGLMWVALLVLAWWQRRTWGRPMVMLIVCYSALLLPVLGFVNIYFMRYSLVSDHWQYDAMIVPCAALAGVSTVLARRFAGRALAISLSLALLVVLGGLSNDQSRAYADIAVFYETTIARNPDCWMAENNLSSVLEHRGQLASAIAHCQRALELKPDYPEAHINWGNALVALGQPDAAIEHFHTALSLDPNNAEAHNNLALALVGKGQIDAAILQYRRALEFDPNYAEAYNNYALVLFEYGQPDAALADVRKALDIKPNFADAHYNLGNFLTRRGQISAAIAEYQQALAIKPDFPGAQCNLATALAAGGDFHSASVLYQEVLDVNAGNTLARQNLAVVASQLEGIRKLLAQRLNAAGLKPNDAGLLNDAAWMLATNPNASIRNGAEAVELAERASKLAGGEQPSILNTLAAAYAEAGRFPDAVRTAEQAEQLASAAGNRTLAEQIRSRLELYRNGKACREAPTR